MSAAAEELRVLHCRLRVLYGNSVRLIEFERGPGSSYILAPKGRILFVRGKFQIRIFRGLSGVLSYDYYDYDPANALDMKLLYATAGLE